MRILARSSPVLSSGSPAYALTSEVTSEVAVARPVAARRGLPRTLPVAGAAATRPATPRRGRSTVAVGGLIRPVSGARHLNDVVMPSRRRV
ncbi:hypothetical protein ACFQX6_33580 [Streptosporangium lutulentum]